ncbi:MAG: MarR family transcriptional regulator [Pseudomonadota bacterium]
MDEKSICAAQAVRSTARLLTRRYEDALRPTGLTASQYTILSALTRHNGLSPSKIGEVLSFDQTTIPRLLDPMRRKGLVQLLPDPNDARRKVVEITQEGRDLFAQANALWQQAQDRTLDRLSPEEWSQARSLLAKLTD